MDTKLKMRIFTLEEYEARGKSNKDKISKLDALFLEGENELKENLQEEGDEGPKFTAYGSEFWRMDENLELDALDQIAISKQKGTYHGKVKMREAIIKDYYRTTLPLALKMLTKTKKFSREQILNLWLFNGSALDLAIRYKAKMTICLLLTLGCDFEDKHVSLCKRLRFYKPLRFMEYIKEHNETPKPELYGTATFPKWYWKLNEILNGEDVNVYF